MLTPTVTGSPPSSRWPGFNLTAAAALVAVLDLAWGRTAARLVLPHAALGALANQVLMAAGVFLGHLAGVLSLSLLVVGLANPQHRKRLFPHTLAVSLVSISALFVLLTGRALLGPVGGRPLLYLKLAAAFLNVFILLGAWRARFVAGASRRAVVGLSLLLVPGLLGALAAFLDYSGGAGRQVVRALAGGGEWLAIGAGVAAAPLLAPRRRDVERAVWFKLAAAVAVTTIAAAFALYLRRFELVQTVAAQGLNLDLPAPVGLAAQVHIVLVCLAAGSIAFTVLSLMGTKGAGRLLGYGLVLLVASGFSPSAPAVLATSLVGSFALGLAVSWLPASLHAAGKQGRQHAERADEDMNPSQHEPAPAP